MDTSIEEQLDLIEKTLCPEGRCMECGGCKPYWRHDTEHVFVPPQTEELDVESNSVPLD